jgi:hypothetical protein
LQVWTPALLGLADSVWVHRGEGPVLDAGGSGVAEDIVDILFQLLRVADTSIEAFRLPKRAAPAEDLVDLPARESFERVKDAAGVESFDAGENSMNVLWRGPSYVELANGKRVEWAGGDPGLRITDDLLKGGHHDEESGLVGGIAGRAIACPNRACKFREPKHAIWVRRVARERSRS